MAYGAFYSATLHVANRSYFRTVGSTTTAGEVAEVLIGFDYVYNLEAVAEIYDQGYAVDMSVLLNLLRRARDSGVFVTNTALRAMMPSDAQLQLRQLEIGSSFTIKFTGIADVIEAIASIFDPAMRAKWREKNRHTAVMNRVEEDRATFELAKDRFNTAMRISDDLSNFNKRIVEDLGQDQADELKLLIAEAYGQAISSLRSNDIKSLEAPSPDKNLFGCVPVRSRWIAATVGALAPDSMVVGFRMVCRPSN